MYVIGLVDVELAGTSETRSRTALGSSCETMAKNNG
jgi:hypothetical protein